VVSGLDSALDVAFGRMRSADDAVAATRLPRLVVAAPGSGHGKTTVATGLMAAVRGRRLEVAGFKVGPDYIDPGYHEVATGRPGRNLDPFLCGEHRVEPLLLHGARGADVAVVEGVMGLFDGRLGTEGFASTAHVAALTHSPVVLVVDVSNTTRTAAAVVHGLATFDPRIRVAGVVLNKAASGRHLREVWSAVETSGVTVLGVLPRDAGVEAPSRHLGLVPAAERDEADASVERLAERVAAHVDLDAVLSIAGSAPDLSGTPWDPTAEIASASGELVDRRPSEGGPRPVVAVAGGRAFTFRYAETEELMRAAGLDPVVVDPTRDASLPAGTAGLHLGGGFPEVHAQALAANSSLLGEVREAVRAGLPTVAECAGLLYLCESLDGERMAGVLPAVAAMGPRLTMGYRSAVASTASVAAEPGRRVTGHEFHRTTVSVEGPTGDAAWLVDGQPEGFALDPAGTGRAKLHASYLHTHWAGHPSLAAQFASSVHEYATRRTPAPASSSARSRT
jgi:cobyrinic acid a,c-diamide synthase